RLLNNTPSPMEYATEMPEDILIEDQAIQELPISFAPDAVEIVPAEEVFERDEQAEGRREEKGAFLPPLPSRQPLQGRLASAARVSGRHCVRKTTARR